MKLRRPQDMTDYGLMVYRFNNPRKNTTQLAAIVGMTTKDFNAAVKRGMDEEALRMETLHKKDTRYRMKEQYSWQLMSLGYTEQEAEEEAVRLVDCGDFDEVAK